MLEGRVAGVGGDIIQHSPWLGFPEACLLPEQMLQLMKPLRALQVNPSDSPSATSEQSLLQDTGPGILPSSSLCPEPHHHGLSGGAELGMSS